MSLIIYNTFVQSEEGMYYLLLPRTRELWYSGPSDETKVSQQESITKLTQGKLHAQGCVGHDLGRPTDPLARITRFPLKRRHLKTSSLFPNPNPQVSKQHQAQSWPCFALSISKGHNTFCTS